MDRSYRKVQNIDVIVHFTILLGHPIELIIIRQSDYMLYHLTIELFTIQLGSTSDSGSREKPLVSGGLYRIS